ncbi:hypothetical protein BDFG_00345 [Blastomyces dermatitidis ATCC 26199]|nr:hypothetical protein BDFG_00345 [Blastomyces dermatitidis ATCC 26199]
MKEMRGRMSLQRVQHVSGLLVWKLDTAGFVSLQASRGGVVKQSQDGNTENTSSGCIGHTHPHLKARLPHIQLKVPGARSQFAKCWGSNLIATGWHVSLGVIPRCHDKFDRFLPGFLVLLFHSPLHHTLNLSTVRFEAEVTPPEEMRCAMEPEI